MKKKGKIVLGQAKVDINGEVYKTSPIEIEIISAVEKPNDPNNNDNIIDGNIHLVAEISKNNPYLMKGLPLHTSFTLEILFQFLMFKN